MNDEYTGPERRKEAVAAEHRLTKIESGLQVAHSRLSDLINNVRVEGDATRTAIKEFSDKQDKNCIMCKKDTTDRLESLEESRTFAKGVIRTVGIGVPAIGSLSWFFFKFGGLFGGHVDKIK